MIDKSVLLVLLSCLLCITIAIPSMTCSCFTPDPNWNCPNNPIVCQYNITSDWYLLYINASIAIAQSCHPLWDANFMFSNGPCLTSFINGDSSRSTFTYQGSDAAGWGFQVKWAFLFLPSSRFVAMNEICHRFANRNGLAFTLTHAWTGQVLFNFSTHTTGNVCDSQLCLHWTVGRTHACRNVDRTKFQQWW